MPLPPALAAKLAKRGILQQPDSNTANKQTPKSGDDSKIIEELAAQKEQEDLLLEMKLKGYDGCPNKWNPYHSCTPFCNEKWSDGKAVPDPEYERRRQKMLMIYPLPDGWQPIYDSGTGRHYYWCLESDKVSWFPPGHPKACPVVAAAKVRENMKSQPSIIEKELDKEIGCEYEAKDMEPARKPSNFSKEVREKQQENRNKTKGKNRVTFNDLDPMDPASYSDIPRGVWSAGLANSEDAVGKIVVLSEPKQCRPLVTSATVG
nr:EOG090X0A6P [Moina brachiata]